MVIEISVEAVVVGGAILGTAARTLYPYWERLRDSPELLFEKKFLGTAIVSFVGAAAIGIGLFPTLLANIPQDGSLSLASVFAITALSAFGLNSGSNMILSHKTTSSPADTSTTTPPSS